MKSWKLGLAGVLTFTVSAVAGAYASGATEAGDAPAAAPPGVQFMTGADPIDPDEYDALPKLGKFRAWLPKKVDLSNSFPKPGYQGAQPNCVAWATTYAARSFLYGRDLGKQPSVPAEEMSPAYVYNRLRRPGSLCNKAIRIVDALNFLEREGSVTFADFPDDISKCDIPAASALQSKAANYRLGGWRAIERQSALNKSSPVVLDDIKGALSRGEPVVFAMPVMDDWKALRGDVVYTHMTPEHTNYHAMALVGYDEDRQAFRVINSWGDWWGDHGYAWIAYDTFKLLATEAYALQDAGGQTPLSKPQPGLTPQQDFEAQVAKLPCGSAQVSQSGGHLTVSGFAGGEDSLVALQHAALAVDPHAHWNMVRHPWPQCEAELTLANPLATSGVMLAAQTVDGKMRPGDPVLMKAGDIFGISATAPAAKPYLSIVYLQADGSAVELYRGMPAADRSGRHPVSIGLQGNREAQFQVGPPFGDEMVIALASDRPLFGDELKDYATEREFLTGLRAKLTRFPLGSVSAAVLRIRTRS